MINCVFVRSRKDMEKISKSISNPSIIISIRDPDKKKAYFATNSNIVEVKYFAFDDWDVVDNTDNQLISDVQAKNIAEFVSKYNNMEESFDLYINCEAGISRSAGVAAAISKVLTDDDNAFFRMYRPNMLVYRKIYNAMINELNQKRKI